MKKARKKKGLHALIALYRNLPRDLHSTKFSVKNRAQKLLALTICLPLMIWGLGYMVSWELTRQRIEQDNAAFSALYTAATVIPTTAPTEMPTAVPTQIPTEVPTETPTEAPSVEPASSETPVPTVEPTPEPTIEPTAEPTLQPTAVPMDIAADASIAPLATPDANTLIYAMETPPPIQPSFGDLLSLNPDTIGFIQIGSDISLPVVHKPNDNNYYLNHSFNCEESIGGTLFLDGSNLLTPEDASLIIYGHNMRNGTMFRPLINYESLDYLKQNPLVQFDTIYENRCYVPFAVFTVSANEDSDRYVNIRQFMFDEYSWPDYIASMRKHSVHNIPVEVEYGDRVLLLVTCEYTHNNGRFVLALRQQRESETIDELRARIQAAY